MIIEESIFIPGPAGPLESKVAVAGPNLVVICHPHPLFDGTMNNKIVTTMARLFQKRDVTTIRFNFRGVGASKGHYAEGLGEQADLQAVLEWAQQRYQPQQIVLAGFSFGAYISYEVARTTTPKALLSIAPPVEHFIFSKPEPTTPHWMIIHSDDDDVVPANLVHDWVNHLNRQPTFVRFDKAGHFFHGQLVALADAVSAWLDEVGL